MPHVLPRPMVSRPSTSSRTFPSSIWERRHSDRPLRHRFRGGDRRSSFRRMWRVYDDESKSGLVRHSRRAHDPLLALLVSLRYRIKADVIGGVGAQFDIQPRPCRGSQRHSVAHVHLASDCSSNASRSFPLTSSTASPRPSLPRDTPPVRTSSCAPYRPWPIYGLTRPGCLGSKRLSIGKSVVSLEWKWRPKECRWTPTGLQRHHRAVAFHQDGRGPLRGDGQCDAVSKVRHRLL